MAVTMGSHLHAVVVTENQSYWIISDGILDGLPISGKLRFLYKGHWHSPKRPPPELLTPANKPGPVESVEQTRAIPNPQSLRDVARWNSPVRSFPSLFDFFSAKVDETAIYTIRHNDTLMDFAYTHQGSDTLVVSFHEELQDRDGTALPVFARPDIAGPIANTLLVSDPALYYGSGLTLAWFAGADTCPFQAILPQIIKKFMEDTGSTRPLFFGISGGGFAAAFYASLFPNSACLVVNPQTRLWRFSEQAVRDYLRVCFQETEQVELEQALRQRFVADLTEVYAEPVDTRMIYLQNVSDHHVDVHARPFLQALHPDNVGKVRYVEGAWGDGHVAAPAAIIADHIEDLVLNRNGLWPQIKSAGTVETILFYGQSNAGAGGSELSTLTVPLHKNLLTFSTRRQLYGAVDVKSDDLIGIAPVFDHPKYPSLQATSMGFSLADKYSDTAPDPRHFFTFTVWYGAQPLSAFGPGTVPWKNLLSAVRTSRAELTKLDYKNLIKALVFVQGEAGPGGRDLYRAKLSALLDELLPALKREAKQAELPVAILLQTNKGSRDKGHSIAVDLAQWDVARSRSDTVLAGPAYQAPLMDNLHQSMIGRLILGDLLALVYEIAVCRKTDFIPLHPIRAQAIGRTIEIEFQLPTQGQALAWDTSWITPSENFGFVYDDQEHSSSIEHVEISGPSSVRITLTNVPSGKKPKIHYAQRQALVEGWASARGQLISPSGIKSYFYGLGHAVPEFIDHYCIRFVIEVQ